MKWVRYATGTDGGSRYGIVEGDMVQEVSGTPFAEYAVTGTRRRLADLRLLTPVMPPTFYANGVNYRAHVRSTSAAVGKDYHEPPLTDIIGYRAVSALVAHGDAIVIPRESPGKIQYEGELVVVIGKTAKHLSEADALSCVLGYSVGNDVSERSWQRVDRTLWRAKNTDTFKPMGPWIETDVDFDAMETIVRVNDKEVARFKTNDMICGVSATISMITRYITLRPGDVIWMGTNDPTLDMVAGDVCEIEISGVGVLRNPVVAEA